MVFCFLSHKCFADISDQRDNDYEVLNAVAVIDFGSHQSNFNSKLANCLYSLEIKIPWKRERKGGCILGKKGFLKFRNMKKQIIIPLNRTVVDNPDFPEQNAAVNLIVVTCNFVY